MQKVTNIAHPLKNRKGTSQRTRIIEALDPESAPIEGKILADRLHMIGEYARHMNFYEYHNDNEQGESQKLDTWSIFFNESLPFQLAKLSKSSVEELEHQFLLRYKEFSENPSKQLLESLFSFVLDKLIIPVDTLYKTVVFAENSFSAPLFAIIRSAFVEPLKCYISTYNSSATFLCIDKRNFKEYLESPWKLGVEEIYALNSCIQKVKKGIKEGYFIAAKEVHSIFYQMLSGMQEIIDKAPQYIDESIRPLEESLQQNHQPHLGLMFTFLEIFKHFQGDINTLGKKHLDFFYEEVLKMIPKEAVPDKAHIVFEVAKHLETYPLPKDLLLLDGKDANKQDVAFGLDHEIILDKAQIQDLRTFALQSIQNHNDRYIEGAYIAPIANSMDGLGKKFEKDQLGNWYTLGSKESKFIPGDRLIVNEHPHARLGFILSSPVLLLQEGKRDITIFLDCDISNTSILSANQAASLLDDLTTKLAIPSEKITYYLNDKILETCDLSLPVKTYLSTLLIKQNPYEIGDANDLENFFKVRDNISCLPIFDDKDKKNLRTCLETFESTKKESENTLFNIWFSGEKEWIKAKSTITIVKNPVAGTVPVDADVRFKIDITLLPEEPAIVFYDEENLKEKIDLKDNFPVVKIELNDEIKIECDSISDTYDPCLCPLKKPNGQDQLSISPYHFLKHLQLVNARIDVDVCGVKNLIVQNDDGTLDINSQIHPFGVRPEVPGFDPMNQVDLGTPADPVSHPELFLGPSFYIGSKEILYKKWEEVRVNMEWKEKPKDFHDYYKAYLKHGPDTNAPPALENFGLSEGDFKVKIDLLDKGSWSNISKIELFDETDPNFGGLACNITKYGWEVTNAITDRFVSFDEPLEFFKNAQNGFLKFTLADQDFLHKEYPFVLARQMLAYAFSGDSSGKKLADAIYVDDSSKIVISPLDDILSQKEIIEKVSNLSTDLITAIEDIFDFIELNDNLLIADAEFIKTTVLNARTTFNTDLTDYFNDVVGAVLDFAATFIGKRDDILDTMSTIASGSVQTTIDNLNTFFDELKDRFTDPNGVDDLVIQVQQAFTNFDNLLSATGIFAFLYGNGFQALIPNEPWTPIIKNLYVDYTAKAIKEDIEIVHLYPFENTSKAEEIELNPTLFPYFDHEGTLFIGIENLTPGANLSLLFQLAEATADSEQNRATIDWYYLSNNEWIELRPDFDVISDETDSLTVSGIVTIAVPDGISTIGNTIMPSNLYWIKVSAPNNVRAIAETIGIHTQAAKTSARLSTTNDTNRLETPLQPGSISKLVEGDFSIKKVEQLYPSFEGRKPEAEGHFYTRVSEQLKHKGRALMANDYEKIVLEGFTEIYKVKCISHTMGLSANQYHRDLEIAPGFVIVAVIPDLTKLMAGNLLEPKAPVSVLEKVTTYLRKKTSPFAKLKVVNPRYEYVDVCIAVRLYRGKSSSFYAQQLKEDITLFLAPWFLGDTEKLSFGQEVRFSDIVGFIEQLDYVDFIVDLRLNGTCKQSGVVIQPMTARSILTVGNVCVEIDEEKCATPKKIAQQAN
ncbi:baseplate J/gp47 family protein [Aquimarina sediminis]|uniref:hypothetical protein n=1 Tax=Aquimarina sediminis TaxID=2070536 RepID=UPI000CA01E34|nr:hypothetical protein [Aquimarina sediminis]